MKFKRFGAALLALVMCVGTISTTAFAYSDENTAVATEETTEVVETEGASEDIGVAADDVPFDISVSEDGVLTLTFGDWSWSFGGEDDMVIGTVVTGGSRLNLRSGSGMNYDIIGQLYPGEQVEVIGEDGDWYQVIVPEKTGYVHSDYLEVLESASENNEMNEELLMFLLTMMMQTQDTESSSSLAWTPDGNLTLVDDVGSTTGEGKQFITLVTKNGNYFYLVIDRDEDGNENVYFMNLVDEADLLSLMDEEEAAQYTTPTETVVEETTPVTEETTEPVVEEPVTEESSMNMMPVALLVIVLIGGGGFLAFKKMQEKKKEKEAAKPDPDADYVDDDEDYGYIEADEDDMDFSDGEDNKPV